MHMCSYELRQQLVSMYYQYNNNNQCCNSNKNKNNNISISASDIFVTKWMQLDAAELDAVVAGVTVLAMQLVVPHPDIGSIQAIPQLDMADAALEAVDMVKQQQ